MSAPRTNYVPIMLPQQQQQEQKVVQPQQQQDNTPSFWDMLQQSIGMGLANRIAYGGGSTTNVYHNEPERPPPATERAVVDRSRGGLPNQPPVRQPPANRTRLQELQAEQAAAAAAARRAPQGANSPIPQQAGQAQVPRTIAAAHAAGQAQVPRTPAAPAQPPAAPQLDDEKKMLDELRHAKKTDYDKMFGKNGLGERLNFINTTGGHKERAVPFTEHSTVNNAIIYDPDNESRFGSFFTPALIHIETGEHKFINRGDILRLKQKADQNRKLLDSTPARNPPGIFGRYNDKRDYGTPGEEKKQPAVNSPEETPRTSIKNFIDANKKEVLAPKEQVLAPTAKPPQQASDMELTPSRSKIQPNEVANTLEDVKQQKTFSNLSDVKEYERPSDIEMYSLNALLDPDSPEDPRRIHALDLARDTHRGEGVNVMQHAENGIRNWRNAELYRTQIEAEERAAVLAAARKEKAAKKKKSNQLAAKAQAAIDKAAAKAKAKEEEAANKSTKKAAKKPAGPTSVVGGVVQTFLNALKNNTNFNEAKAEIKRQNSNLD